MLFWRVSYIAGKHLSKRTSHILRHFKGNSYGRGLMNSEKWPLVKCTVIFTTIFFELKKLVSNQFIQNLHLQKSTSWLDFPGNDIFETPSKRKCSIFNLLWPNPSIQKGQSEKFVIFENKIIFEGKNYTAFLVWLGTTSEQK